MKVYLVSGNNGDILNDVLSKYESIKVVKYDRTIETAFNYLDENSLDFDVLLLLDQGIGTTMTGFIKILKNLSVLIKNNFQNIEFKFVTRDALYADAFKEIAGCDSRFDLHYIDQVKIPVSMIKEICLSKNSANSDTTLLINQPIKHDEKSSSFSFNQSSNKPLSLANPAKTGSSETKASLNNTPMFKSRNSSISNGFNRIAAITGHRGSGVTSTAANLAVTASSQGFNTAVLDFDVTYRAINLYFSKFGEEVELNSDLASSLIKCLVKPDSFSQNSCRITSSLSVSTLAYSIESNSKVLELINMKRIISLLSILRQQCNLVLLDVPISVFKQYPELLIHIDCVGLCLNNNLYSIINSIKSIDSSLTSEDLPLLRTKSKLILTKYNSANTHHGKVLSPELTSDILTSISSTFETNPECAGFIPLHKDFDLQIDLGKKLCTVDNEYKNYFLNILNNLI